MKIECEECGRVLDDAEKVIIYSKSSVWDGKRTYVGHVPDSYQLKDGERFGLPSEDWVEVIRNK